MLKAKFDDEPLCVLNLGGVSFCRQKPTRLNKTAKRYLGHENVPAGTQQSCKCISETSHSNIFRRIFKNFCVEICI